MTSNACCGDRWKATKHNPIQGMSGYPWMARLTYRFRQRAQKASSSISLGDSVFHSQIGDRVRARSTAIYGCVHDASATPVNLTFNTTPSKDAHVMTSRRTRCARYRTYTLPWTSTVQNKYLYLHDHHFCLFCCP